MTEGLTQNPFSTLLAKAPLPKISVPWCAKPTKFVGLKPKRNDKTELVVLQGKKPDVQLLNKLSPYFRNSVSKELLKAKLSANEELPSLCYSCNRSVKCRHERTISFNRIKLTRRAVPAVKTDREDSDAQERFTSSPWKYSRAACLTSQSDANCTPFKRFDELDCHKQCFASPSPLILPEVTKITPQKKATRWKGPCKKVDECVQVPPPTPILFLRELSPQAKNENVLVIRVAGFL